jgi:anti-anti-sigma factor
MDVRPFSTVVRLGSHTLVVSGSIDEQSVDEFRSALHRYVSGTPNAIVDLSDVDFLPSMAVGALVGAMKRAEGSLTIVAGDGCVAAKVLAICGIPFELRSVNAAVRRQPIS